MTLKIVKLILIFFYKSINYTDLFEQSDSKFYCKRIYSYSLRFIANYDTKMLFNFMKLHLEK